MEERLKKEGKANTARRRQKRGKEQEKRETADEK